ncbi:hypothetical protein SUGI_1112650 [Cryptomeria japonica]|nr:hypothetical protein SUGI_1112650 [Cryptomeria japonica]
MNTSLTVGWGGGRAKKAAKRRDWAERTVSVAEKGFVSVGGGRSGGVPPGAAVATHSAAGAAHCGISAIPGISAVITVYQHVTTTRFGRDGNATIIILPSHTEREKAQAELKRNHFEYRAFLESCDFIKVDTQWRKVQDRLEDDERCSRLDKTDRLEVFQEYICDLEKEEEKQKIQKEQFRQKERKNRDEFRRLMEDHKATGLLTAKTQWLDYRAKVKDHLAYLAVASNTSGSPPKDLFEDVAEEMKKQYQEDKANIKDALKAGKFTVRSTWTLDKFKASVGEAYDLATASETNLKLVFEEVLEQAKEKEEKKEKKRQRLADDFMDLLYSVKEIIASSKWEDCIPLLDDAQEYRAISD